MSNDTTGLWDKLLAHRKDSTDANASEPHTGTEERLKSFLENEKVRTKSGEINLKKDTPESSANARRPDPVLRGKLADYLGNQPGRQQFESIDFSGKRIESWVIDDAQKRAAIALSLILTSHLARFAGTGIGTRAINDARDEALREIDGRDAVRLDIEAYELLNWFAAAIDPQWQNHAAHNSEIVKKSASEDILTRILDRSIQEKIDLKMRYYTGSRGEFSERVITPIAISAEKYLIAFCHIRQEERVFRLSRILQLSPVSESDDTKDMYFPVYKKNDETTDTSIHSDNAPLIRTHSAEHSDHIYNRPSESKFSRKSSKKRSKTANNRATSSSRDVSNAAEPKASNHRKSRRRTESNDTMDSNCGGQQSLFGKSSHRQSNNDSRSSKNDNQQYLPGFSDKQSTPQEATKSPDNPTDKPDKMPRLPGL